MTTLGNILWGAISHMQVRGTAPTGGTTIAHPAGTLALPLLVGGNCYVGTDFNEPHGLECTGSSVTIYSVSGSAAFTLQMIPWQEGNLNP
jgi:hypothetical protein